MHRSGCQAGGSTGPGGPLGSQGVPASGPSPAALLARRRLGGLACRIRPQTARYTERIGAARMPGRREAIPTRHAADRVALPSATRAQADERRPNRPFVSWPLHRPTVRRAACTGSLRPRRALAAALRPGRWPPVKANVDERDWRDACSCNWTCQRNSTRRKRKNRPRGEATRAEGTRSEAVGERFFLGGWRARLSEPLNDPGGWGWLHFDHREK